MNKEKKKEIKKQQSKIKTERKNNNK